MGIVARYLDVVLGVEDCHVHEDKPG